MSDHTHIAIKCNMGVHVIYCIRHVTGHMELLDTNYLKKMWYEEMFTRSRHYKAFRNVIWCWEASWIISQTSTGVSDDL